VEAIVLAGGLGTRLQGMLQGLPKPMAPVAGRPFLEFLLSQLARAGCSRVILSVGHLHHVIETHFGVAWRGMIVDYEVENTPLGTGGALRAALAQGREENILVLNGDTFLHADYAQMMRFHAAGTAQLTIAVTHQPDIARYGGVLLDAGRIVGFEEKGHSGPGFINAGAYVICRDFVWPPNLPGRFSFETDVLAPAIALLKPAAFKVNGLFIDIGIPEDLARAQTELAALKLS
jgi:D-glycero-alpha-D-manno-heptose 1-phosphate guanylyltransferase